MKLYWVRVGPNAVTSVLIRKENKDTGAQRGEGHLKMEAEIGILHL